MSNTSLDFWDVDGTSLNTYAFNIETIGGGRLAPPPLRGEDLVIPGVAGKRYMPKVVDSRTITLGMWVIGAQEDGSRPTSGDAAAQFDHNFRKLRNLLWTPDRQVTLTKRFYVDGVLKTAIGHAQYAGGLEPTMNGRGRAVFTVDLFMTDPYFYSDAIVTNLTSSSQAITVEGDAVTAKISFAMNGSRTNPKVHNNELNVDVEYHADLASGDTLAIDVPSYTSVTDPASTTPFSSVGSIRHSGAPQWFLLQPGTNTLAVSATSGTGLITMTHQAAWL